MDYTWHRFLVRINIGLETGKTKPPEWKCVFPVMLSDPGQAGQPLLLIPVDHYLPIDLEFKRGVIRFLNTK